MEKKEYKQNVKHQSNFDKEVAKSGDKIINPWVVKEPVTISYADEKSKPKSLQKKEKKLAKIEAKHQKKLAKINSK